VWRRFRKHRLATVSLAVFALIALCAVFADWVAPYGATEQNLDRILEPPGGDFLLGTDTLGRDTLSRILHGGRISLLVGVSVALIGGVVGTTVGLVAGYCRGLVDSALMRFTDTMLALPGLMVVIMAARVLDIGSGPLREALREFTGVQHRLEYIRTLDGVRYINDSKATNVNALWFALESFDEPVVLLAGGRDKGNCYDTLTPLVRRKVKALIAFGESADTVMQALGPLVGRAERAGTLEEATVRGRACAPARRRRWPARGEQALAYRRARILHDDCSMKTLFYSDPVSIGQGSLTILASSQTPEYSRDIDQAVRDGSFDIHSLEVP